MMTTVKNPESKEPAQVIEADLIWNGQDFEPQMSIEVDAAGTITYVGPPRRPATQTLARTAILPGFVNAHSHAFQRGLRGHGETFPQENGSFWTWREAMYGLVDSMTPESLRALCVQAFQEMRAAGITCVGEFHYLHHDASGAGFAFDDVVLSAAAEVGIRIVLLNAFYSTGGIDQPLSGGQRRFATPSTAGYWEQMDALREHLAPSAQHLGAVVHSIRAATLEQLIAVHGEAMQRGMVFHMHVEEQPKEIEDCVHRYGKPPMGVLNTHLAISPLTTAVHCTHTALADMETYVDAGGNVCLCPLTEANLGDGIANVPHLRRQGGSIALGTDSNSRLSFTEEMRWLEYAQRLIRQKRGVCLDDAGRNATALLEMATRSGARSLGISAGRILPGYFADLLAINLDAMSLQFASPDTLLEAFVFGAGDEAIHSTCVAGQWVQHR